MEDVQGSFCFPTHTDFNSSNNTMSLEMQTSKKRALKTQTSEKIFLFLVRDHINENIFCTYHFFYLQEVDETVALCLAKTKLEKHLKDLIWHFHLEK